MHAIIYNLKVLKQFLIRDWYLFRFRFKEYGINYIVIYPLLSILIFSYLQPGVYFGEKKLDLMLFAGNVALTIFALANNMLLPFLFDLFGVRFINYQLLLLHPRFILLEQLLFSTLFSFTLMIPYFPLTFALLSYFYPIGSIAWIKLFIMIFITALFSSSFNILAFCMVKSVMASRQLWLRIIWPLLVIGGLWVPWQVLYKFNHILAYAALLNPFIYMTEGFRTLLVSSEYNFSFSVCIISLLIFCILFMMAALYFFKKKIDHI
jgi:hypothetical protein